jgi:type VI secretion system protein ImpG
LTAAKDDIFLNYYAQELAYLRQAGAAFADRYPKIAARLQLGEEECPDPHVERLIESFAFLTGRIQYNIDSEFPHFTTALLENLYPHYLQPVPSVTIAQFRLDAEQELPTDGFPIAKHTPLHTRTAEGHICRFRTCFPLTLWPLEVVEAASEPPERYEFLDQMPDVAEVLRLRFRSQRGPLKALALGSLRLFLHGHWLRTGPLYEILSVHLQRVALLPAGASQPRLLSREMLQPAGLDEELLLYPPHAHPAYRLLQEYFAFPEKFLFFDLAGLERLQPGEEAREFDVLFLLDRRMPTGQRIDADTFRLGCTPVINLFTTVTEPIRIHQRRNEYRLSADVRRERHTEIHSIRKVTTASDLERSSEEVQPFFSFRHATGGAAYRTFWYARRVPTVRPGQGGSDIQLHFMDLDFNPRSPPHQTLFAHVYCTNRHLAAQVPEGGLLRIEQAAPLREIVCLRPPSEQIDAPLGGKTVWRIISHLNLNYLSLSGDRSGLEALQELLRLYNFQNSKSIEHQVAGLHRLASQRTVRRLGDDAWRGFVRGHEITLEFNPDMYVGSSAAMLASVLERFFALYAPTNSFTQLVAKLKTEEGIWKKWPPRTGCKPLL